jgi:hypothetical protein
VVTVHDLPRFDYGTHRSPCWTFWTRSVQTWDDLIAGWDSGIRVGEETLTESNLLAVHRAHSPVIRVIRFTRVQEHSETGADWEWWFTTANLDRRSDRGAWIGLRFQAKVIDRRGRYRQLNTRHGRAQADVLVTNALADGVYPIYVFYNAWRRPAFAPTWNCETFPPMTQLLGCAIAPASVVQPLLTPGRRNLARTILALCVPWSCLVCCERRGYGSLTDRVQGFIHDAWPPENGDDVTVLVRDTPPPYLAEGLDATRDVERGVETQAVAPVTYAVVASDPLSGLVE